MVDDPEGRASDFDDKIPDDVRGTDEIAAYMRSNYGHVLPDSFIDAVAPHVDSLRDAEDSGAGFTTNADIVFDPDAGQYRDADTGHFVEAPEDG